MTHHAPGADFRTRLQDWIPKLVLSPSLAAVGVFVYGFIAFTIYLSFTGSKMLPSYDLVGFENYAKLWNLSAWWVAVVNLMIFATLYITICTVIGLTLAILLDPSKLDRDFVVKDAGTTGGIEWLQLTPKQAEAPFKSARLGFADKGLAQMEYVDALGQRTRISFTGWKRNPAFARGTFVYVPAKGVDVIGG